MGAWNAAAAEVGRAKTREPEKLRGAGLWSTLANVLSGVSCGSSVLPVLRAGRPGQGERSNGPHCAGERAGRSEVLDGWKSSGVVLVVSQFENGLRKQKMIAPCESATPDRFVYIIAGNLFEARSYAKRERLELRKTVFVSSVDSILGARNVRVVWVGTFFERRDFLQLCDMVDGLVYSGMALVDRREVVNKGRKARKKNDT